MGYADRNVYYYPEALGLKIVGTLDEENLNYEFNTLVVLEHMETGRVFYCSSSGCSCPTPFDEYYFNTPDDNDLNKVTLANFSTFQGSVDNFPAPFEERQKLLRKVRNLLNAGAKKK